MKKTKVLFFLTWFLTPNAQTQSPFYFYRADGQRVIDTALSINGFIAKYFDPALRFYSWDATSEDKRLYVDQGVFAVLFKDLTATPYGVVTIKKLAPTAIYKILQRFSLSTYLNSKPFYDSMKELVEEKKLSKAYLLETLGSPSKTFIQTDVENEKWSYASLKLDVFFEDSLAVAFDSKNYLGNIGRRHNALDNIKYFEVPSDEYYNLTKVINKGRTHYTLELYSEKEVYSSYVPMRIILKDGNEIRRNSNAFRSDGSSRMKTFGRFFLTPTEASLLSKSNMVDFKLGDLHEVMPTKNAETLKGYFKALLNLK